MRIPLATYRLQFSPRFGFADARALVPYLDALGISDLYASPLFQARSGSEHGYDCTDPTRLNPELGSQEEFEALISELQARGMGLLLDIVPNHLAASDENTWWMDVLENGPSSRYAEYFDIDWSGAGDPELAGRVLLPVLTVSLDDAIRSGQITLANDADGPHLRTPAGRLPLAPGTLGAALAAMNAPDGVVGESSIRWLLDRQMYRLAHWREATRRASYRRFFDVSELVGLRQELPEVFDATHQLAMDLYARGQVTGFRVDHVDGLLDPLSYLRRLSRAASESALDGNEPYIVVEKILQRGERLPGSWPVAGTTGYEFAALLDGVFVDPSGVRELADRFARFTEVDGTLADITYEAKRQVARDLFGGEVRQLAGELATLAPGVNEDALREALVEVSACLPVYRTYYRGLRPGQGDRARIQAAVGEARRRAPHIHEAALQAVQARLLGTDARFIAHWQQFTGALTAKGFEDTAFYRYVPLASLMEVGVSPDVFERPPTLATFHREMSARARRWPYALSATTTHDSKRGEDVRARLHTLSDLPAEWAARVEKWMAFNAASKCLVDGSPAPDSRDELLLYQTLLGAWPLDDSELPEFGERIARYMVKAAREARWRTSWLDVNAAYEEALVDFAHACLHLAHSAKFLDDFVEFKRRVARLGMLNSLSALVLKLAAPGVPDFYQGTEVWDFSLVDPDNRRPVDFARRQEQLRELLAGSGSSPSELLDHWEDGRIKLFVTARGLGFRRENASVVQEGAYLRLVARGDRRTSVIAFARRQADSWIIVAVPRFPTRLSSDGRPPLGEAIWGETVLLLPPDAPGKWLNGLTDVVVGCRPQSGRQAVRLAEVFSDLPVALMAGQPD